MREGKGGKGWESDEKGQRPVLWVLRGNDKALNLSLCKVAKQRQHNSAAVFPLPL